MAVAVCLTTACAGDPGRYPSLAIRDIERTSGQSAAARPISAQSPAPAVATSAEIAALVGEAKSVYSRFQTAQNSARIAVNAGRGQASDSLAYTGALLALADLSSLRSDTALVLGEFDMLASQAKTSFAPETEINDAQAKVLALVEEQDEVLARLWRELNR